MEYGDAGALIKKTTTCEGACGNDKAPESSVVVGCRERVGEVARGVAYVWRPRAPPGVLQPPSLPPSDSPFRIFPSAGVVPMGTLRLADLVPLAGPKKVVARPEDNNCPGGKERNKG